MRYQIEDATQIGGVIRAARKTQQLRQVDAAGLLDVSESFMVKAERGGETIQWGKLFQILTGLGVRVEFDIPEATHEMISKQVGEANRRAEARRTRLKHSESKASVSRDQERK
ncbi:helix-turn-helix domain-containing protein [Pandoraea sp. PE-S2T-3]|uniref:helix-turn-helix domain-containing protein n=1 Tax=Pandoraea sp. PE-S2T-3 TaxID=1986993 RepID=UPI000B403E62|nr:helix-turn-helix domain-containing protein [Pandoraea sp. PE-S2T-3]